MMGRDGDGWFWMDVITGGGGGVGWGLFWGCYFNYGGREVYVYCVVRFMVLGLNEAGEKGMGWEMSFWAWVDNNLGQGWDWIGQMLIGK